jgi:hypothetical protein
MSPQALAAVRGRLCGDARGGLGATVESAGWEPLGPERLAARS